MRSRSRNALTVSLVLAGLAFAPLTNASLFDGQRGHGDSKANMLQSELIAAGLPSRSGPAECADTDDDGVEDTLTVGAVNFECLNIDMLSFLPNKEIFADRNTDVLTGGGVSDIWGWTSPDTGDEYILVGATNGAAAVRITDPENPEYLGQIFNTGVELIWFDIKMNDGVAYIVSESLAMGMKMFELSLLDSLIEVPAGTTAPLPVVTFPIDLTAHNVVIDEAADMLYLVGSGNLGGALVGASDSHVCNGLNGDVFDTQGLFGFDISVGMVPVLVGCHATEGYVHDAHCTTYTGPDTDHEGASICVTAHEDGVAWVDVTDPASPVTLFDTATAPNSAELYPGVKYSHQGWMSEDQTRYYHGDELDESSANKIKTRTFVFDMTDLDDVKLEFINEPGGFNIDHNMYTHRGLLFQSNYTAGLQVFEQEPTVTLDEDGTVISRTLKMVAEFDVYPDCGAPIGPCDKGVFAGTWSNYPYFESGTLAVTATEDGLFFLKLDPAIEAAYPVDGDVEGSNLPAQASAKAQGKAKGRAGR